MTPSNLTIILAWAISARVLTTTAIVSSRVKTIDRRTSASLNSSASSLSRCTTACWNAFKSRSGTVFPYGK